MKITQPLPDSNYLCSTYFVDTYLLSFCGWIE